MLFKKKIWCCAIIFLLTFSYLSCQLDFKIRKQEKAVEQKIRVCGHKTSTL